MYFKNFCINKRKWKQRDLNPLPLSSQTNAQAFNQPSQMIEMFCVDLSVGGRQKFTQHWLSGECSNLVFPLNQTYTEAKPSKIDLITMN